MPEPRPAILIVDDDPEFRRLTAEFLTGENYDVELTTLDRGSSSRFPFNVKLNDKSVDAFGENRLFSF